jgi:hypothetical protein
MKVAVFTFVVALAAPAAAQIVPCTAAGEPGVKVLLDDIVAADPALETLANTLAAQVEQNLEQLKVEAGLDVKVRACRARRPLAPSDFQRPIVEQLLDREVALEVWGRAVKLSDADGPFHQAEVGYVIVPVRFFEFNSARPPGAFVITQRSKPIQSVDDMVRLLNQSGRIGAYAALASGTMLLKTPTLKAARWDPARKQLCRAAAMLQRINQQQTTTDTELSAYAEKLAAEALTGARSDPQYAGTLKFLPVGAACPK